MPSVRYQNASNRINSRNTVISKGKNRKYLMFEYVPFGINPPYYIWKARDIFISKYDWSLNFYWCFELSRNFKNIYTYRNPCTLATSIKQMLHKIFILELHVLRQMTVERQWDKIMTVTVHELCHYLDRVHMELTFILYQELFQVHPW